MKALRTIGLAVAAVALAGAAVAAAPSQSQSMGRVGIGMNLGTVDATYELDPMSAVGFAVNLDITTGDLDSTNWGFGVWYQQFLKRSEPVGFFTLAGLGYGSNDGGFGSTDSALNLFAGIGAEYFLPGTKSLSIEAKMGLNVGFESEKFSGGKASLTRIGFKDLTGGLFLIRYYLD